MAEDMILVSLFPTQAIEEERLEEMLSLFEAEEKLMPEKWGNEERVRKSYDRAEIQQQVKEGIEAGSRRFDDIYLHRSKKIKYSGRFSTRLHIRSYLKFKSKDKKKDEDKKLFFDLGDKMARLTKPKFGVMHIFFANPDGIENAREYELMETCGQPIPVDFLPNGAFGVGLRTYFGEQFIEWFGREFLLKAPAHVEELDWGGIRIDLVENPWEIDQETLLRKWIEVMAYLEPKGLFAKYEIREDGSLGCKITPSKVWLDAVKKKKNS